MSATLFHNRLQKGPLGTRGSTLPAALMAILFFALSGTALLEMNASQHVATGNEMTSIQALQVGTGGLEYAKSLLDLGLSPDVTDKQLGTGTFTITTDPATGDITVTSQVGAARKVQSINSDFAKNCVALDTSGAFTQGSDLHGIKLTKSCGQTAFITSMIIDWDWSDCVLNSSNPLEECPGDHVIDHDHGGAKVTQIGLNGATLYDPDQGYGTPTGGADAGEEMVVVEYGMTPDGDYLFEDPPYPIRFSETHPGRGLYFVTVEFADGSQITDTFQDPTQSTSVAPPLNVSVDHGQVEIPAERNVKLETICSEITYGRYGPRIPVTVELGRSINGSVSYTPLFDNRAVVGGESTTQITERDEIYTVRAKSNYRRHRASYDSTNTLQVKTLMNGELAPVIPGYGSQRSAKECLAPYLGADGEVTLESNQVIILFELGVDLARYPNSPAADFQDLVVLFTVTPTESSASPTDTPETTECNQPGKILICHVPPGNHEAAHTLCVDIHGWENGHNGGHGIHIRDYLGACTSTTASPESSSPDSPGHTPGDQPPSSAPGTGCPNQGSPGRSDTVQSGSVSSPSTSQENSAGFSNPSNKPKPKSDDVIYKKVKEYTKRGR